MLGRSGRLEPADAESVDSSQPSSPRAEPQLPLQEDSEPGSRDQGAESRSLEPAAQNHLMIESAPLPSPRQQAAQAVASKEVPAAAEEAASTAGSATIRETRMGSPEAEETAADEADVEPSAAGVGPAQNRPAIPITAIQGAGTGIDASSNPPGNTSSPLDASARSASPTTSGRPGYILAEQRGQRGVPRLNSGTKGSLTQRV